MNLKAPLSKFGSQLQSSMPNAVGQRSGDSNTMTVHLGSAGAPALLRASMLLGILLLDAMLQSCLLPMIGRPGMLAGCTECRALLSLNACMPAALRACMQYCSECDCRFLQHRCMQLKCCLPSRSGCGPCPHLLPQCWLATGTLKQGLSGSWGLLRMHMSSSERRAAC